MRNDTAYIVSAIGEFVSRRDIDTSNVRIYKLSAAETKSDTAER